MIEDMREDFAKDLSDIIGEKVGHFLVKFAPKGAIIPVPAVQTDDASQVAISVDTAPLSDAMAKKQADVDGMVNMIMHRVVERVKEDECLSKISTQYDQVKSGLDELLTKIDSPDGCPSPSSSQFSGKQFDIVKALALDMRRMRQQRNRDYTDLFGRIQVLEEAVGSDYQRRECVDEDAADIHEDGPEWPFLSILEASNSQAQDQQHKLSCTSAIAEEDEENEDNDAAREAG
jgi:hypothetical protein